MLAGISIRPVYQGPHIDRGRVLSAGPAFLWAGMLAGPVHSSGPDVNRPRISARPVCEEGPYTIRVLLGPCIERARGLRPRGARPGGSRGRGGKGERKGGGDDEGWRRGRMREVEVVGEREREREGVGEGEERALNHELSVIGGQRTVMRELPNSSVKPLAFMKTSSITTCLGGRGH